MSLYDKDTLDHLKIIALEKDLERLNETIMSLGTSLGQIATSVDMLLSRVEDLGDEVNSLHLDLDKIGK